MFDFLSRKKFPLVGVDITNTSIKLVELSRSGRGSSTRYRLESYGIEPLPPGSVVERNISNAGDIGDALASLVKSSGTKAKWAAIAVPSNTSITKVIQADAKMSEAELEAYIRERADEHIPSKNDGNSEPNLDFQIKGPSENNPGSIDVLFVASAEDVILSRKEILDIAGLKAAVVDVEVYALERACIEMLDIFAHGAEDQNIAIMDIGATTTSLIVISNRECIFNREMHNFGGQQLTIDIQTRYGVSIDDAEKAKLKGGLPDNYDSEVLARFKDAVASQIELAVDKFYESNTRNRIDHLVLAGGVASIMGLDEVVERKLNVPTTVANPFANASVAPRVRSTNLGEHAPALMTAVGLALRAFD
ncbi:hypothetical protein TI04_06325 [Achromatium sp. WMS2]|nr:hypothetical protein TI04_06325 [Achromatium sp. WMS2]